MALHLRKFVPLPGWISFSQPIQNVNCFGNIGMARSLSKERLSSEGREFFGNCDINQLIQGHAFLFCSPTRFFEQGGSLPAEQPAGPLSHESETLEAKFDA